MSKLFGKVMASLLSGAMLFGGTSFADGGDDLAKVLRKAKVEEVPKDASCVICLRDRVDGEGVHEDVCDVVTGCRHYFCRNCILKWMDDGRGNKHNICPVCKREFVESAKNFLSAREWLQLLAKERFDEFISYCKKHSDVAFNAAFLGVYFPLLVGATIYSWRNQEKSGVNCDPECDGWGCCCKDCDGCDGECGCVIS